MCRPVCGRVKDKVRGGWAVGGGGKRVEGVEMYPCMVYTKPQQVICKSQSIVRSHKDLQPLKRGSRERMDVRTCASNVIIPRV